MVNPRVTDCYRLAKFYGTLPTIWLEMPLSEVRTHLERTIELKNIMDREGATSDDD